MARADHDADLLSHLGDVDGQGDGGRVVENLDALRDVGGLVADALEVAIDLDDGEDEAEIDGHGLLFGEQIVGHLVDVALGGVDGCFDLLDVVAEAHVAGEVGIDGEAERLLRECGHGEQFVFQGDELLLKIDAGHGESLSVECHLSIVTQGRRRE